MTNKLEKQFATARQQMVQQIVLYVNFTGDHIGVPSLSERVVEAISSVPRHEFVPLELRGLAYTDQPLPIGYGKTISQPFIVALMTDLLDIHPEDRILEVGTGLGYQAAILASLARQVYSVEIIQELAEQADQKLVKQGYDNIFVRVGDGSHGWPDEAPFDKVIVTAAPELIPTSLLNQLKPGGRMVIPAGVEDAQQLLLAEKDEDSFLHTKEVLPVRFTPLVVSH